ncbi:winged helix-turn-helix domain-containing protein [Haladaptatus sp. CMSO5]|uniref:winged helix-turn-helix domain-containing protein n=1 Tax=Haladaptatus sp. CMSO5 TaxID=3120514 RepID=UPI002FCDE64F
MEDADDGNGQRISAEEAFSLLANETRVSTLEALWKSWDDAVPFSELRRQVGVRDAGQFHYHLSKLCDHFVCKGEDGYSLTPAGFKIAQSVVAGTGIEMPSVESTSTERACPCCGNAVNVRYADGAVRVYCSECPGFWSGTDEYGAMERGYLGGWEFPPAGLRDRTTDERLDASIAYMITRTESLMLGVCPDCGGKATGVMSVCETHDPGDEVCTDCGRNFLGVTHWRCETCKLLFAAPSWAAAVQHPRVRALLTRDKADYRDDLWRALHVGYEQAWDETIVSENPLRVRITIPSEGDTCELVLDESGKVIEVR